ncbi:MAG: hypothetical protein LBR56_03855, partial [Sporomusaceae bacterium]|nr:hypothetical protein [Sporomusaceae bacterium]
MTKINNQSTHLPPPFEIFGNSGSVVIFGAAENGKRAQKILSDNQINIKFFVDNDAKKWGKTINDVLIVSPDYLFKESKQIPVFIASSSFNEIEKQLK